MILFCVFLMSVCLYNPIVFGVNLSNVLCIFGFCVTLLRKGKIIIFSKKNNLWCALLCLYILAAVSILYSQDFWLSIKTFIKLICLLIVILWTNLLLHSNNNSGWVWKLLLLLNVVASSVGIFQLVFGIGDYHLAYGTDYDVIRLVGAFPTPNIYGNFLCLTIPSVILRIKYDKRLFIVLLMNIIVLYKTYSRSSILFLICSIILLVLLNEIFVDKKIRFSINKLIWSLCCICMIFSCIYYLTVSGKLSFLFQTRHSNLVRLDSYIKAINMIKDNPIGRGIGIGIGDLLDSGYLNIGVDLGLIGLIFFVCLAVISLRKAIRINIAKKTITNQIILLSLIMFWLINIFENAIYDSLLNPIFGIIFSVLLFEEKMLIRSRKRCITNESTLY